MGKKRIVSVVLCVTLGMGVLSGCKKDVEEREPTTETVINCPATNEIAMKSPTDVALRYFYLINEGDYENACKLIDTSETYCNADLLQKLYEQVQNYSFTPSLVALSCNLSTETIENGGKATVNITFADSSQSSFATEQSYSEEDMPVWYDMTEPYVYDIAFCNVYDISDMNEDNLITQADMELEDEEDSITDDEEYIDDFADDMSFKKAEIKTELLAENSENKEDTIDRENGDTAQQATSIEVYNIYPIDITVKNKNGVYYVCLPSPMMSSASLKLHLPKDMEAYINGVQLTEDLMDLDDNYIIPNMPMYSYATLTLKNKVDDVTNISLDLTKRVYYIYDYVMPTRKCKNEALDFAGKAIIQLYSSLSNSENYSDSEFVKKYVHRGENENQFKDYYDKNILTGSFKNRKYTLIDIALPEKNSEVYEYDSISYENLQINNGNYLTLPIVANMTLLDNGASDYDYEDDYAYDNDVGSKLSRVTVYGNMYLTKDNGEWKVWSIDKNLLLEE